MGASSLSSLELGGLNFAHFPNVGTVFVAVKMEEVSGGRWPSM